MKEFKFSCPSCGQRILAPADSSGRKIDCPSCQGQITIPAGPTESKKPAAKPVAPASAAPSVMPKLATGGPTGELPKKPALALAGSPPVMAPPKPGAPGKGATAASPAAKPKPATPVVEPPEETEQVRLSILTPAIRGEIVRGVRKRIADESHWLPSKVDGEIAYAAREQDGKREMLDVKNAEATKFSLIGAFQREFQKRKVVSTAVGRTEILDHEIPDAIREVILGKMSEEEREKAGDPLKNKDRKPLSHAQCLKALDILEDRYAEQVEQARDDKAKRKLGTTRLTDLIPKLERKARIQPEEVATALYHEVMDLRKRLEQLDARLKLEK